GRSAWSGTRCSTRPAPPARRCPCRTSEAASRGGTSRRRVRPGRSRTGCTTSSPVGGRSARRRPAAACHPPLARAEAWVGGASGAAVGGVRVAVGVAVGGVRVGAAVGDVRRNAGLGRRLPATAQRDQPTDHAEYGGQRGRDVPTGVVAAG